MPPLIDPKYDKDAQWSPKPKRILFLCKVPFTQGCDLCATCEQPEILPGRSVVAETQKVLFLCKCCSMTLVRSLNHQTAVATQQVAHGRQSGGRTIAMVAQELRWWPNGGTMVATVTTQWTPSVGQRRHYGGTKETKASLKLIHNVYNSTHFMGRPMADPCAAILWPWWCVCLPPTSFEWPVSDCPPRWPLCDCFDSAKNLTATMAFMARSEHPLCHPWETKATFRRPLCLQ